MLVFELAAAIAALAAAPQHAQSPRSTPESRAATTQPAEKRVEHNGDRNRTSVVSCRKTLKGYDARNQTYRDARGKRQRCTR